MIDISVTPNHEVGEDAFDFVMFQYGIHMRTPLFNVGVEAEITKDCDRHKGADIVLPGFCCGVGCNDIFVQSTMSAEACDCQLWDSLTNVYITTATVLAPQS